MTEWKKSFPDIHHINTGRGNTTFAVFPDGTNMLIDMGDMSENHPGRLSARNTPALPNNIQSPAEWVADYIFQFHPQKQKAKLDYALITHDHDNHFEEIDGSKPMHGCGQLFTNRDQIRTCLLTSNNSIYNYERR